MRKIVPLFLVMLLAFSMAGCSKTEPEKLTVYSFSGECEQFTVINGIAVFSDTEELFHGGELKVNQEYVSGVTSWTTTFYTMSEDGKRVILSNSMTDMTGGSVNVSGDLGRVSGDSILTGSKVETAADLKGNLFFELTTTDADGEENTYELQFSVVEVTGGTEN